MVANFPGVNKVRKRQRDGSIRVHYYLRSSGARLSGEPGTHAFAESYATAIKSEREGRAARVANTIKWLLAGYLSSSDFAGLRPSTQLEYRRMLREIEERFGDMPLDIACQPEARGFFLEWRDELNRKGVTRAADNRLSVLSALLSFGVERGSLSCNRLAGFKRGYHADRSDKIWTNADVERFTEVASPELRLALYLALYTAQRQADLLRLTWRSYRDGRFTIAQEKTGQIVTFDAIAQLREVLEAHKAKGVTSTHVLTTPAGLPWKKRHFSAVFKRTCDLAGIEGLHFHDLRGTAVTMLSAAGCTPDHICSITGHKLKSAAAILEKYRAITTGHGTAAMAKLENYLRTDSANRLQTVAAAMRQGEPK